jgi:hypothetical protein
MAFRDVPDMIVPPSHLRCEAMTKPCRDTYQVWRKESHRCVRRATQSRAGHSVCWCHAAKKKVRYWDGAPDKFWYKRFWKWPHELSDLAKAVVAK